MVPSVFVITASLPRLPNGKLARKALAASGRLQSFRAIEEEEGQHYVAPQDEVRSGHACSTT